MHFCSIDLDKIYLLKMPVQFFQTSIIAFILVEKRQTENFLYAYIIMLAYY